MMSPISAEPLVEMVATFRKRFNYSTPNLNLLAAPQHLDQEAVRLDAGRPGPTL